MALPSVAPRGHTPALSLVGRMAPIMWKIGVCRWAPERGWHSAGEGASDAGINATENNNAFMSVASS